MDINESIYLIFRLIDLSSSLIFFLDSLENKTVARIGPNQRRQQLYLVSYFRPMYSLEANLGWVLSTLEIFTVAVLLLQYAGFP